MINEQLGQNPPSPHPNRAKFVNRLLEEKQYLEYNCYTQNIQFSIPISYKTSLINLKNTET